MAFKSLPHLNRWDYEYKAEPGCLALAAELCLLYFGVGVKRPVLWQDMFQFYPTFQEFKEQQQAMFYLD